MTPLIDMTGEPIGPLHVMDRKRARGERAQWWCWCDNCNAEHLIRGQNLRRMRDRGDWAPQCMMEGQG